MKKILIIGFSIAIGGSVEKILNNENVGLNVFTIVLGFMMIFFMSIRTNKTNS
jgi:hypothetical protein